jgi:hypothetical protein
MFCLECGSEMAIRATACPVCGHVYGDRERSLTDLQPARKAGGSLTSEATATSATSATSATPAHANAPTVKYVGEVGPAGLPRDLPGRFALGISLGLAADLLLPWVSVNGTNVTPTSIGAPVIVVVALLAAATLPVFTTSLRQHPVWSGLPLIIGAFCAGIAGSVWLLLAPLAQIFAQSFGSDPTNLALSPQGGLYLFLIGSAALLVSGQRMLAAMHEAQIADTRRDAARALQLRQATPARPGPAPTASISDTPHNAVVANPPGQGAQGAGQGAAPTAQPTPATPVLPGSDAWHQAPAAPTPVRSTIGGGWGKSRGPQRLR